MSNKKRKQKESIAMVKRQRWVMIVAAAMAAGLLAAMSQSCIKNDIPYPRIQANFATFEAEGLASPATIDKTNRFIDMTFEETVDMEQVRVTSYTLEPEGVKLVSPNFDEPINMSSYVIATLSLYQDYDWVIRASQPIERYFTVAGQVGQTVIDVTGKRVVVTVPDTQGRKDVEVLTAKLGPQGSTMTPDPAGKTYDLSMPLEITVTVHGREEKWEVFCELSQTVVNTLRADAGSQVAWVYGSAIAGAQAGVEYRQQGLAQWVKAPSAWITQTGNTFYGRLQNLNPETTYEVRTYAVTDKGTDFGDELTITTGSIVQLPNSSFDEWTQTGKYWSPWPNEESRYWDTSNKGSAVVGKPNVAPTTDTSTGVGYAAELSSVWAIAKFASGSIFTGSFVRIEDMNGVLSFGRPFTERPVKLRGYFKYNSATIDRTNSEYADLKGRPDSCIVWCALTDLNEPFEIRTSPSNRNLFDPQGSYVIAYGSMICGNTVPQYIPFEFELEYNSTERVPTQIIVVAASSKYGDYFTGGVGSKLFIDDLELLYDY